MKVFWLGLVVFAVGCAGTTPGSSTNGGGNSGGGTGLTRSYMDILATLAPVNGFITQLKADGIQYEYLNEPAALTITGTNGEIRFHNELKSSFSFRVLPKAGEVQETTPTGVNPIDVAFALDNGTVGFTGSLGVRCNPAYPFTPAFQSFEVVPDAAPSRALRFTTVPN